MSKLQIAVKGEYFDAMKRGEKVEEYRLVNDYWRKRLVGRNYDRLVITRGYPAAHDEGKRLNLKFYGSEVKQITHAHFGDEPAWVFAIVVKLES